MMAVTFELVRDVPADAEFLIEGVVRGEVPPDPLLRATGFEAARGQIAILPGRILVGLDAVGAGGAAPDALRHAAAVAARAASRCAAVATTLPAVPAVAEGFGLGAYRFTRYKSDSAPTLRKVYVLAAGGGAAARRALERGARVAEAVALARDLVNEPGGTLTAESFATVARSLSKGGGFSVKVLNEQAIAKAGLAGLVAVNRGSEHPARFVELTYEPAGRARGTVALVGKGITFDSGGLSLKTADGMLTMKDDMGGAAAVLAAVSACGDLGVKVRVRAFLPLTDNMTGGDAQRVGDVITYRNGKTVEVLNTDAEGRLVLADALIAASNGSPDAIIDIATLTGAQEVALGKKVAALFSSHPGWGQQIREAADVAGEPVWPMPLVDTYRRDLDSKVADLRNVTAHRSAGAITAALFLREFVGEQIPWAHLDIAGPAFAEDDDGELSAGGTGFGVRTLLQLLSTFRKPS